MNTKLATAIIAVDHGKLRLVKSIDTTTQAIASYQVQFTFGTDTEWSNLTKTAIFQHGTNSYAQILDSDNCAVIPWEILNITNARSDIFIDIGLLGVASGVRLPTNKVRIKVLPSTQIAGSVPQTPTPTAYEQLLSTLQGLNDYDETEIKAFIAEYCADNDIATETYVNTHANNSTIHITQVDRQNWNAKANASDIPTKVSDLTNDSGYLTTHQDISGKQNVINDLDTIRAGAALGATAIQQHQSLTDYATKQYVDTNGGKIDKIKVNGTEQTITDKAVNITVPTKTSDLTNDADYLTQQSLTGLATETYVDTKISEIPTPDVSGQINTHNVANNAHNDIRVLISDLTSRLNSLADSDDTTLDQLSEIVTYIKNNKSLIDGITTNKINVSDIINNLTTNVSNKPLSAAQGVALKALIDAIEVPTKTSDLTNDSGYLTQHQNITGKADKVTSATSGNFAGLDANGNLTDSGYDSTDFITTDNEVLGTPVSINADTLGNHPASHFVMKEQGVAHAGKFLVVGSDGNITTVTMQEWQGGSY